jgi:hypothetical protein
MFGMNRRSSPLSNTICLLLLSACAENARVEPNWRGSTDTLANGTLIVQNPEQGVWSDADAWELVTELRIGAADGDSPDVFSEIAVVGVSPTGLIHAIDGHSQEVRVFAPTGAFVRSFGGRGAGPGEFENAYSLDWDAKGNLWVSDAGNNRYAVYDSSGALLRHVPRTIPGVVFPWLGGFMHETALHDLAASQGPDGITRFTYYQVDTTGAVQREYPPIEHRRSGPPLASMTLFWLTPRTTFAFDARGYIWIANTGEYRIIQRSLDGDTVRIIAREYATSPVSPAERDSVLKELQSVPPAFRDAPIPSTRPVMERLFVSPDGTLYVKRFGGDPVARSTFDVFDAEGRYLGQLRSDVILAMLPALPRFVEGAVYGVTTDSLGVHYIVRARLAKH